MMENSSKQTKVLELNGVFLGLLQMCRDHESSPAMAMGLKLGEECGEVQTAILKDNGFLEHKVLDEDVMHEIADVMNVCCSILTATYPQLSPTELLSQLSQAMEKKADKYSKVLKVEFKARV